MAGEKRELKVVIVGDSKDGQKAFKELGGASDDTDAKVGKFGANFGKVALAIGAAAAAGAAVAGKALFDLGQQFDSQYDTIRVGTGATGEALEALNEDFKAVAVNVPASMDDVSVAIADLNTRTGATGEHLQDLSTRMLEMTRLTGGDLAGNIASVTRVFGDWSIAAGDQTGAMDALFRVAQSTGIGIDALSQKVVQFGAPMRQFGFSFEESISLMGKWEKEGVNMEAIMAGMKAGLGKLSKAGEDPVKAFGEIQTAIMNAGSVGEANAIAIETFGQRAGPDMAAAVREGRFAIDDLVDVAKNGSETILTAAEDTESFDQKWQKFKNRMAVKFEPAAIAVFDALGVAMDKLDAAIPVIEGGLERAANAVRAFSGWVKDNETPLKVVAAIITGVMLPALVRLGVAAVVSGAQAAGAWLAMQAGAIRAGAAYVLASWQMIGAGVAGAASAVANAARVVGAWVLMGVQSLLQAARMAAAWVIAMGPVGWVIAAVIALVALIIANWDTIVEWTKKAWDWIVGKIVGAWVAIVAKFNYYKALVVAVFTLMWETLKGYAASALAWVVVKAQAFVNFFTSIPGKIRGALSGMWDGMKSGFKSIINWIIGKWNNLGFTIPSVTIFGKTLGGGTISTPNIPYLADGGTIRGGGAAVVGEAGAELLELPRGASVTPLSGGKSIRPLDDAAGAGIVVNVTVEGNVTAERDLARSIATEVRTALVREDRNNGRK